MAWTDFQIPATRVPELETPTLGLLLIALAAIWDRSAGLLRLAGYASLLMALALLIAMG